MVAEFIFTYLGKTVLDLGKSTGTALLKQRAARLELAQIGERSVEAAIVRAPALAEDLRSATFVEGVVAPIIKLIVEHPSILPDPEALAGQYVDRFVTRFAKSDEVDRTLVELFQTSPDILKAAVEALLVEIRQSMASSKHWRELAAAQSQEEIRSNVAMLVKHFETIAAANRISAINLEDARRDARNGSAELREWPKDIAGEELHRPEADRLSAHLKENPGGTSLLIGEAGSGKSALLADLTARLERDGITVFALKADTIPPTVKTIGDIGAALGINGDLSAEIAALASDGKVVLLIDQLDAVSDVMDRSSARMQLLLRLVRQIRDARLPIHVIVSSRPFEAAHDARFRQLKAEEFKLALPAVEQVTALLQRVEIAAEGIDPKMLETLRRPFALKLFVAIAQRGIDVKAIKPGQLLDTWLTSAGLGSDSERERSLALMEALASEMIETETLWRPSDRFETKAKDALSRCEACGLIVRSGGKIGFSHQSWLDDFQAKGFRDGKDLADYAWRNQDSLFLRATVVRSLERLRALDERAYGAAITSLLFEARTRRHLKHLVVDLISTQSFPLASEEAWIRVLVQKDPILANRALGNLAARWDGWRGLRTVLPTLMRDEQYEWRSVMLLAAEARFEPDHIADLITAHWPGAERDGIVFRVLEQAGTITPNIEAIFNTILGRTTIDQFGISHFVTTLRSDGKLADASRVVALWAASLTADKHTGPRLHGVGKLALAAPLELASALLPWFVALAERDVEAYLDGVVRYPQSKSLPWDWDYDRGEDGLLDALRTSLNRLAETQETAALVLMRPLFGVEVEQVQELFAWAFTAGAEALANDALDFLLADERRLQLGDAHVNLEPGLSGTEAGLSSQELIEAITPHLDDDHLAQLRDSIERWSLYGRAFGEEGDAKLKRLRLQWNDQSRLELLERLPNRLIAARRRRQIREWRAQRRRPMGGASIGQMATFVGSPMSHEAMMKGSDEAILNMLNELHDTSSERPRRRPISRDGGVTELSRAFGAFALAQPERAIAMAETRLVPSKHERAAGELVEKLAKESVIAPDRLIALIHHLSEKGFSSGSWARDASWALSALASKANGLDDRTIGLLRNWLDNDPARIASEVEARLANDAINQGRNSSERTNPESMLFDRHSGVRTLPQNNYTILGAIFQGLMNREPRPFDEWLVILEEQAGKAEDPNVWSILLYFEGRFLFWADRARATALLDHLWEVDRRIFDDIDLLPTLWSTRAMFSPSLIRAIIKQWLASDEERKRQGAAEFIQAGQLIEPDEPLFEELKVHLDDRRSELLTGRLFSASAAWREDDPLMRPRAHQIIMGFAPSATGDAAYALSGAVSRVDRLIPDELTKDLIRTFADNPALLTKSIDGRFADGLQGLLLYPGFDEPVLEVAERIADLIVEQKGGPHRGLVDEDLVQVTIALQRNDGPLRARAMDAYERLLDAGAYGAEQAARDAIGR
ncbi:MAG: ATP-binding protein [Pseudomonadota bacterium]